MTYRMLTLGELYGRKGAAAGSAKHKRAYEPAFAAGEAEQSAVSP